MSWQISEKEFLIMGRSYPIALSLSVNRVKLPGGTLVDSANEYFRVSADGGILEWYRGPSTSTLEDCLYVINIHAVVQTSLVKFFWTECYGREGQLEEKICLHHLKLVAEEALPFDPVQIVEGFHVHPSSQKKGTE
jgi:hypothetical protein